jgi:SAM-dependent methyltransferase
MTPFDERTARVTWDRAADAYARGQASGRDFYRCAFFGPAQVALVGEVAGACLLDVGCGAGYFAREMAARGATVTAVDISPRMIEHARAAGGGAIAYEVLDATALAERYASASFDVVTACLALQDMPDPARVLRAVRSVLAPGGRFIVSIEHPCTATPTRMWERGPDGSKLRLGIAGYFARGPVSTTWRGWEYEFRTVALHAPLEDWFRWIGAAGFVVRDLREPCPTPEALAGHPGLADATLVPYFLLLDLRAA